MRCWKGDLSRMVRDTETLKFCMNEQYYLLKLISEWSPLNFYCIVVLPTASWKKWVGNRNLVRWKYCSKEKVYVAKAGSVQVPRLQSHILLLCNRRAKFFDKCYCIKGLMQCWECTCMTQNIIEGTKTMSIDRCSLIPTKSLSWTHFYL